MERLPDIHKIAVLRAIGLGDFIATTPALYALRAAYPDADIAFLSKPWLRTFLAGRPSPVDRVIVVPVKRGVREEPGMPEDEAELRAFFRAMQAEKFDLAVQMHGGGRNSNPFVQQLGARISIGMKTPDAPPLDRWMPYVFYQNEFMRLLELVGLVGARPQEPAPHIVVVDSDLDEAAAALPDVRLPYVVLHPGATDIRRHWPLERYAQVGDMLGSGGFQIVVTGVEEEREMVEKLIAALHVPAVNACGRLSLNALTGLLARAALMISNDTGPMHLAAAIGTPTIGIFWCGNLLNWAHFGRARYRPLASWVTHCSRCGADMTTDLSTPGACPHNICFVDGVTVEQVAAAAFDLLAYEYLCPQSAPA